MDHPFFLMNDQKLYAKDDSELEGFLRIVKGFNNNLEPRPNLIEVNKKILIMSDQIKKQLLKIWSKGKLISTLALMSLREFNTPHGSKN